MISLRRPMILGVVPALIVALTAAPALAQRGIGAVSIRDKEGTEIGLYRESHALVIGVSDYTEGWPKLPGVLTDVQAVKAALEGRGFQGGMSSCATIIIYVEIGEGSRWVTAKPIWEKLA